MTTRNRRSFDCTPEEGNPNGMLENNSCMTCSTSSGVGFQNSRRTTLSAGHLRLFSRLLLKLLGALS